MTAHERPPITPRPDSSPRGQAPSASGPLPLTREERSACAVATIAAPHEVRVLLDIVERLTGERFEDRHGYVTGTGEAPFPEPSGEAIEYGRRLADDLDLGE